MKRTVIVWTRSGALSLLLWSGATSAQVPTASFDDEDEPSPSASPKAANPQPSTAPNARPQALDATGAQTDEGTNNRAPVSAEVTPTASAPIPASPLASPAGMAALEERAFRSTTAVRPGFARLSLYVSEPGSTVFVTRRQKEFDERQFDSALARCSTQCVIDLPLGSYMVWVRSSDEARSARDFELRSSRWMSVAPANQVMRDFGFAAGAVGTVATILGIGILSELVCKTCTSTGRNITGGLAFGLGLPMGAVGWSLYFIHREARITDHVLTQAERPSAATADTPMPSGVVLQTRLAF